MHRKIVLAASAIAATLACRSSPGTGVKPLAPIEPRPEQMIDVSSLSGSVLGADAPHPSCPVRPHVDGSLAARGITGVIQYRWERGDSTQAPLRELSLPPAGADGMARAKLVPDEWADTLRGVQREVTEQLHVTYPFAALSAPITIEMKCY